MDFLSLASNVTPQRAYNLLIYLLSIASLLNSTAMLAKGCHPIYPSYIVLRLMNLDLFWNPISSDPVSTINLHKK